MKKHYPSIALLRGIAAFGIVACHLNLGEISDTGWKVRQLCDMNVGLFAALSGFMMLHLSDSSWGAYANRRLRRLLPIYFVWTLVYVVFGFIFDFLVRHGINPKWSNSYYIVDVIFSGGISSHLWFIAYLLYVQLVFCAFVRIVKIPGRWLNVL